MTLLKACLNGGRRADEHPGLPLTPEAVGADAAAAVAAGAGAIHIHPRDAHGHQSLRAADVAAHVAAVRAAAPGTPVGVTTIVDAEPDPGLRLVHVGGWAALPDFASVNFWEDEPVTLAETLLERGVAVEAGLSAVADARLLASSGLGDRVLRVLLEPAAGLGVDASLALADELVAALDAAGVAAPRLLHGRDDTAWPVLEAAIARGLDVRMGLEDVLVGPDGSAAAGNADLLRAAAAALPR
jgi:uncharacterized protein (DUF849 family)